MHYVDCEACTSYRRLTIYIVQFQLIWDTSRQKLGEHYQILQIQSNAPDYRRKHRPKHVELTWRNKLIYIVHLVGYFYNCITVHGFVNVKFVIGNAA